MCNPAVNHLHQDKLTFSNKKHKFHNTLIQTGRVMVVPEGTEKMHRVGADYSMLSTEHKTSKSHHAVKEPKKDRAGGPRKGHKHYEPIRIKEHEEHKHPERKTTSRERERDRAKSTLEPVSSSFAMRKTTENQEKEGGKYMTNVAFKEPTVITKESRGGGGGQVHLSAVSKRPPSTTESSNLSGKKLKSLKRCREGGSITVYSQIFSSPAAPLSTYMEKKGMKERSHRVKTRHKTPLVKRGTDSDSSSGDEILVRSVQSVQSTSSSCRYSSSSDSEFKPLQMHRQGPLHSMVKHLPSEHSDGDRSSVIVTPTIQDSRLLSDTGSDVDESYSHSQEVLPPIPRFDTKNMKMLEKKSPDSYKSDKVLKQDTTYIEELVELHRRLMALRERNVLQQIVNLIEETGHFNVTQTTFDFDLFSLDESTVRKLQGYLQATGT